MGHCLEVKDKSINGKATLPVLLLLDAVRPSVRR
jgi:hypothetical protein